MAEAIILLKEATPNGKNFSVKISKVKLNFYLYNSFTDKDHKVLHKTTEHKKESTKCRKMNLFYFFKESTDLKLRWTEFDPLEASLQRSEQPVDVPGSFCLHNKR